MGVSPRVPRARATPPAGGGDAPRASCNAGAVSIPPAPTPASLGEEALGSRRSRPPRVPCPCPPGRRSTWRRSRRPCWVTAAASAPLDQDPVAQSQPGLMLQRCLSSPRLNVLAKTPGCADKRWGDLGVSQALLQILVIFSLQLLLPRKSS